MHDGKLQLLTAVILVVTAAGCVGEVHEAAGVSRQPVVYGSDDRLEPFEAGPPPWLGAFVDSRLLALGFHDQVAETESGRVALSAPSLRERYDLCEGERFAAQPSFANCTGVLMSESLVLTAGHCARIAALDEQVAVGHFAYEAPEELAALAASDLHRFSRVVAHDDYWDYAWLELTRPARAGAALPFGDVAEGDALLSVNHGAGLPAKVSGAAALAVSASSFSSTFDAFGGASGGPVFSTSGELVGILTSGALDYVRASSGCLETVKLPDEIAVAAERTVRVSVALDGLCKSKPDAELCFEPKEPVASCSVVEPGLYAPQEALLLLAVTLLALTRTVGRLRSKLRRQA